MILVYFCYVQDTEYDSRVSYFKIHSLMVSLFLQHQVYLKKDSFKFWGTSTILSLLSCNFSIYNLQYLIYSL